jgi:myo-inositol-1(or 4)-monophosphatase
MHPLLNIAVRAARRAGDFAARNLGRLDRVEVFSKGRNDFVTDIDRAAERDIIETIRKAYPHHHILGEEGGALAGEPPRNRYESEDEVDWIVDPLDGTTNFMHGLPQFAVSIGIRVRGRLEHGVIYDPNRQELFTTTRGGGAMLESRRLRVSTAKNLEGALVGTGYPPHANAQWRAAYLNMLGTVMDLSSGVRRTGCASLDLAYVAAGRFDCLFEFGLQPWDTAAGLLMVQEAGGQAGTFSGEQYEDDGQLVAGSPKAYAALIEALRPHLPDAAANS